MSHLPHSPITPWSTFTMKRVIDEISDHDQNPSKSQKMFTDIDTVLYQLREWVKDEKNGVKDNDDDDTIMTLIRVEEKKFIVRYVPHNTPIVFTFTVRDHSIPFTYECLCFEMSPYYCPHFKKFLSIINNPKKIRIMTKQECELEFQKYYDLKDPIEFKDSTLIQFLKTHGIFGELITFERVVFLYQTGEYLQFIRDWIALFDSSVPNSKPTTIDRNSNIPKLLDLMAVVLEDYKKKNITFENLEDVFIRVDKPHKTIIESVETSMKCKVISNIILNPTIQEAFQNVDYDPFVVLNRIRNREGVTNISHDLRNIVITAAITRYINHSVLDILPGGETAYMGDLYYYGYEYPLLCLLLSRKVAKLNGQRLIQYQEYPNHPVFLLSFNRHVTRLDDIAMKYHPETIKPLWWKAIENFPVDLNDNEDINQFITIFFEMVGSDQIALLLTVLLDDGIPYGPIDRFGSFYWAFMMTARHPSLVNEKMMLDLFSKWPDDIKPGHEIYQIMFENDTLRECYLKAKVIAMDWKSIAMLHFHHDQFTKIYIRLRESLKSNLIKRLHIPLYLLDFKLVYGPKGYISEVEIQCSKFLSRLLMMWWKNWLHNGKEEMVAYYVICWFIRACEMFRMPTERLVAIMKIWMEYEFDVKSKNSQNTTETVKTKLESVPEFRKAVQKCLAQPIVKNGGYYAEILNSIVIHELEWEQIEFYITLPEIQKCRSFESGNILSQLYVKLVEKSIGNTTLMSEHGKKLKELIGNIGCVSPYGDVLYQEDCRIMYNLETLCPSDTNETLYIGSPSGINLMCKLEKWKNVVDAIDLLIKIKTFDAREDSLTSQNVYDRSLDGAIKMASTLWNGVVNNHIPNLWTACGQIVRNWSIFFDAKHVLFPDTEKKFEKYVIFGGPIMDIFRVCTEFGVSVPQHIYNLFESIVYRGFSDDPSPNTIINFLSIMKKLYTHNGVIDKRLALFTKKVAKITAVKGKPIQKRVITWMIENEIDKLEL